MSQTTNQPVTRRIISHTVTIGDTGPQIAGKYAIEIDGQVIAIRDFGFGAESLQPLVEKKISDQTLYAATRDGIELLLVKTGAWPLCAEAEQVV